MGRSIWRLPPRRSSVHSPLRPERLHGPRSRDAQGRRHDHGWQRSSRCCTVAGRFTDVGLQDLARDGSNEPLMAIAAIHSKALASRRPTDTRSTSRIARVMPRGARTCGFSARSRLPRLPAFVPRGSSTARRFSGAYLSAWVGTDRRDRPCLRGARGFSAR